MPNLQGALRCESCGAVWKSPAAHQIAYREGRCLRCGKGPLIDEQTGAIAAGESEPDEGEGSRNSGG